MTATQEDVVLEQGATFNHYWEIQNKDLTSGYTFLAKVRTQHAGTVVFTLSSGDASLTVAKVGSHSHVTANMIPASTAALAAPAMHVYDLEYTQTSTGIVTRAVEGSMFITPEATR